MSIGDNPLGIGRNFSFLFIGQLEIWAELTHRIWNFPSLALSFQGFLPYLLSAAIVPNSVPNSSTQNNSGFLKEI